MKNMEKIDLTMSIPLNPMFLFYLMLNLKCQLEDLEPTQDLLKMEEIHKFNPDHFLIIEIIEIKEDLEN